MYRGYSYRLVIGNRSVLLTGDDGTRADGWILASGRPTAASSLRAGHHGSSTAKRTAFVNAVDPALAAFESGRFNAFDHPGVTGLHAARTSTVRAVLRIITRRGFACRCPVWSSSRKAAAISRSGVISLHGDHEIRSNRNWVKSR